MNGLSLNVITSSEQFILDMIDQIPDNNLKRQMFEKYLSQIKEKSETSRNKSHKQPQIYTPYTLQEVISRFNNPIEKPLTLIDLKEELNSQKKEIIALKQRVSQLENNHSESGTPKEPEETPEQFLCPLDKFITRKWYINITLVINKTFTLTTTALVDSGADINCIREGLIPTQYYEKTKQDLSIADGSKLWVKYKLTNVSICNQGMCLNTAFIMIPNLVQGIILGTPFLQSIQPMTIDDIGIHTKLNNIKITYKFITSPIVKNLNNINLLKTNIENKQNHTNLLKKEINFLTIEEKLKDSNIREKINQLQEHIQKELCHNLPNAFWERKMHMISLPYEDNFTEDKIPTKARPSQMDREMLEYCKQEIKTLLDKGLITPSKSPWSCAAFYVNKHNEIERGTPRLVINYKPLNKALKWIRYPIPNKKDLLNRINKANFFSKFDLKSGFWQIQIDPKDKYKTAFTVPFGQYEWTVLPFGLKNAPSNKDIYRNRTI